MPAKKQAYDSLTWTGKIGVNIEVERQQRKMTRTDLQKAVAISRYQYDCILKGIDISAETLERIAIALKCPLEVLKPPYEG